MYNYKARWGFALKPNICLYHPGLANNWRQQISAHDALQSPAPSWLELNFSMANSRASWSSSGDRVRKIIKLTSARPLNPAKWPSCLPVRHKSRRGKRLWNGKASPQALANVRRKQKWVREIKMGKRANKQRDGPRTSATANQGRKRETS